jgi:hypothetical protein
VAALTLGTGVTATESIASTGTYTTTFLLFGPTMAPPNEESVLLQGVTLDTGLCAALLGLTGYQNVGVYEVQAKYEVLDFNGGRLPMGGLPYTASNTIYYGAYNFTALP